MPLSYQGYDASLTHFITCPAAEFPKLQIIQINYIFQLEKRKGTKVQGRKEGQKKVYEKKKRKGGRRKPIGPITIFCSVMLAQRFDNCTR